jgi:hypothetical protein
MLIRNYEHRQYSDYRILICDDLARLKELDADSPPDARAELLVWQGALTREVLMCGMSTPDWPLKLLEALPPDEEWPWLISTNSTETPKKMDRLFQEVALATGIDRAPVGNVTATLKLRGYGDHASGIGGLDWWRSARNRMAKQQGYGFNLVSALVDILSLAASGGSLLQVEQISAVVSKDGSAPVASITPRLHADIGYGVRETALASLVEKGWNGFGGAIFLPRRRMNEISKLGPMTLTALLRDFPEEPVLTTNSGDVIIYDGMIGFDRVVRKSNGIPHISPDLPGTSSRLAILMRHRYVS